MIDKLKYVIIYFCANYPHKSELSKSRLTKMVYLADWKSCREECEQISNIEWEFNRFGPYVEDVVEVAKSSKELKVTQTSNMYGEIKELIELNSPSVELSLLTQKDREILDEVIHDTQKLIWNDFIEYIYSTYPIRTQLRYTKLNLKELAKLQKNSNDTGN